MRFLRYLALLAAFTFALSAAPKSEAQVAIGLGYGPPVCSYGYYDYAPYACAPYGYYGPEWFNGGLFIGAGPWFHGGYGYRGYGGYGYRGGYAGYGYRGGYGGGFRGLPTPHGYGDRGGYAGGFHGGEAFHGGGSYGGGFHGGGGGFHGGGGGAHGGGHR